jgi:hypothetical protein
MDSSTLEHRVVVLEKHLRRSRRFARAVGLVACCVLLASIGTQSRYFRRVRQLEVYDEQGRTRIVLDAEPTPRLVFKSETGEKQIVLGIGDAERAFPFDQKDVPHLALETGQTSILLSVSPAPQSETLDEPVRVESALLQMTSGRTVEGQARGKTLITGIYPNEAALAIATFDPEHPAASVFDPGVKLTVDEAGKVTTKLGDEQGK